jgi:tetratricopeptide (TPR) repeat protein
MDIDMTRGTPSLLVTATLIVSGCAASADKIEIRPLGSSAVQVRPPSEQIAYARAQLAMGNIGLAIEGFRKANREQPESAEALAGLADSYAAMGKRDLARRYYEAALAVTPHDPTLLQAVAPPATNPAGGSATTTEDPARVASSELAPAPSNPAPVTSITMKLPEPVGQHPERLVSSAPRLERMSPGEVALVTTGKPLWQAVLVSRTRLSTTVRWEPIRSAAAQPPIRLLNAARHQGLAARTRQSLSSQGWSKLAIGDAPKVRNSSIVLYPGQHESIARNLASRLGFRAVSVARGDAIVVLLGRDFTRTRSHSLRG